MRENVVFCERRLIIFIDFLNCKYVKYFENEILYFFENVFFFVLKLYDILMEILKLIFLVFNEGSLLFFSRGKI